jgi:twitching motility protein PilT
MHVNDLLKIAVERGASDLHLKVGSYPMMRLRGELTPAIEERRLDHEDTVAMAAAVMSTIQRQKFKDSQEIDFAYSIPGLGRFRCNVFQQRGTIGLVLRVIPVGIRIGLKRTRSCVKLPRRSNLSKFYRCRYIWCARSGRC